MPSNHINHSLSFNYYGLVAQPKQGAGRHSRPLVYYSALHMKLELHDAEISRFFVCRNPICDNASLRSSFTFPGCNKTVFLRHAFMLSLPQSYLQWSTVRSTFNSELIDESVTNCHMFGYDKQRIGKFLRVVQPGSSHGRRCRICTYRKSFYNHIVMLSFGRGFATAANSFANPKYVNSFVRCTNCLGKT